MGNSSTRTASALHAVAIDMNPKRTSRSFANIVCALNMQGVHQDEGKNKAHGKNISLTSGFRIRGHAGARDFIL